MAVIILNLYFFTEYPDGVGDTVNCFLLPELSISAGSKADLLARRWNTALDNITLTTYVKTAYFLQHQRVFLIVVWEAEVNIMEQWAGFLVILLGQTNKYPAVYKITLIIDVSEDVTV